MKFRMILISALLSVSMTACSTADPTTEVRPTETTAAETADASLVTESVTSAVSTTERATEPTTKMPATTAPTETPTAADTTATAAAIPMPTTEMTAPPMPTEETNPPRFTGSDYLGTWTQDKYTITVEEEPDGYLVQVQRKTSDSEETHWIYHCTYHPETWHLLCDGTGVRTDYHYNAGNTSPEETVCYTDGTAEFWHSDDGYIGWMDRKENTADDLYFAP